MNVKRSTERRAKMRFPMNREMRYKVLEADRIVASGVGTTANISSNGVAFHADAFLRSGSFIELSISWPAMLADSCPMRLIVFGRVLRGVDDMKVCTVDKWEFRTAARTSMVAAAAVAVPLRADAKLMRWVEYRKEVIQRTATAHAMA